jgi:hypothetical protein
LVVVTYAGSRRCNATNFDEFIGDALLVPAADAPPVHSSIKDRA